MRGKIKFGTVLWIILFLLIAAAGVVGIAADLIEMQEIGYNQVFFKNLEVRTLIQLIFTAAIFVVLFVNNMLMKKVIMSGGGEMTFLNSVWKIIRFSLAIALLLGIIIGSSVYGRYMTYINSVPFGINDPIFSRDIGYYVFQRPFLSALCNTITGVMLFQAIYLVSAYVINYAQRDITSFRNIIYEKGMMLHVIVNIVIYFAASIFSYRFKMEEVLYSEFSNGLAGAGYTEINVWLRYYKIAPFLIMAVVIATLFFILKSKIKPAVVSILIVPAVWIITLIISGIVQLIFVNPYEMSKEREYMSYNIDATRAGFGLNDVEEREFEISNDLTPTVIEENKDIIDNIRITDINSTLVATNSIQGLRSFYTFSDNDVTVYDINGKKTAVNIAAREFDEDKLKETSKNYINTRMRYTHGYGIVMNAVSEITSEGQPDYLIKNIPLEHKEGVPGVTQPRIYFGELTDDYVIVGSDYKELDYMDGDQNIEYSYTGKAGIKLNFLNRMIFAAKEADPMFLLSGYINSESKLLTNRNILDRVEKVAPFLDFDSDPYIVITDSGEIKWIIDAYTKTEYYPYAQRYENINYIRNSAKAVVDAYDGTVTFYITDKNEPIINMYSKMYPGLFSSEEMPSDIKEHIRYSERLFKLQAEVYKKYHVSQPETFYSNSDIWVTAKEKYSTGEPVDVEPYYNLMTLEGENELVLMLPFTPQGKENLVSWMAGRTSENGEIIIYTFPKGETVYGTLHIENKIDNDPNISKEIALWDQGGSSVIKGNLLVIPVDNSLLYVEPIYITTQNAAAIPEVKRIVVAYGEDVVMAENIDDALNQLFAIAPKPQKTEDTKPVTDGENKPEISGEMADITQRIVDNYILAKEYNISGDYENFGKALSELDKAVEDYKTYQDQGIE